MIRAIDVHAHVFNLKYLPVAAILNHSGLANMPRRLAEAVAATALALTKSDPTLDGAASGEGALAAVDEAGGEEIRAAMEDFDSYLDALEAQLPDEIYEEEAIKAWSAETPDAAPLAGGGLLRRLVRAIETYVADGRQYAKWVFAVATQKERTIVDLLIKTYGAEVELFVHHMMDMKSFYRRGTTDYEFFPRQVERMERLAAAYPRRLLAFTAWDPFRNGGDRLDTIKEAIDRHGCRGVKVYPPSGYRPLGNAADNRHPRVEPPSPEEIDRRNLELFRWCVQREVPVFTHCTPLGFEAYKGAGKANASPRWWRHLLETSGMRNLRLCLGHAGGDTWFGSDEEFNRPDSYPAEVVRLCREFPNVYCEFGILDHVAGEDDFRTVRDRLAGLVGKHRELAGKILYGSDWHMLYMHRGHEDFLRHYKRLFSEPELAPHSDDFFRNNAVRYLGLPASMIETG